MLTSQDFKYIKICSYKVANISATAEKMAKHFNVCRSVVDAALRYGRKNGFFTEQTKESILEEIRALNQVYGPMLGIFKKVSSNIKKGLRRDIGKEIQSQSIYQLTTLSKQLLEYITRRAELRGLYKKVLNIEHSGNVFADAVMEAWKNRNDNGPD